MSYLEFCAVDISPCSFILGRAFHRPPKPPFSWFAQVIARARAIACASYQGLKSIFYVYIKAQKLFESSYNSSNSETIWKCKCQCSKTRLVTTKIIQTPDAKITNVQAVWKSWKQFPFWTRHRCTLHFPQVILMYSWHKRHLFLSLVGIGQCPKQS